MAGSRRRGLPDGIHYGGAIAFLVLVTFVSRVDVGLVDGLEMLLDGALLIGTIAAVVWVAYYLVTRPVTPTVLELSRASRRSVSWMGPNSRSSWPTSSGYGTSNGFVWGSRDQDVDIAVNPQGERIAVQCKNYTKPVGNRPVQEVYAGARHHRCVEAWVVAPPSTPGEPSTWRRAPASRST